MGHVDAGKSTLMGRLLHDLGQVSQKEVHKNQREAAQAGKVRRARGLCAIQPHLQGPWLLPKHSAWSCTSNVLSWAITMAKRLAVIWMAVVVMP